MRSTCSLYVDAGYLLAAAATRVTGTSFRKGIHVEFRPLIASLIAEAEERSGLPVLRVHWYDSAHNGVPDAQQERIGELSKVKLRLGRFGVDGQQKGVDLRIGLDLVAHARNGAGDVFFLVSGDDDLTEAVEEAQIHGVQVVVLAVPSPDGKAHAVSRHLLRAADELGILSAEVIDPAITRIEVPRRREREGDGQSPTDALTRPIAAQGRVPSPRDIAAMPRSAPPAPETILAYQGSTGSQSQVLPGYDDPSEYEDQIEAVVTKVLSAFRQSASSEDMAALQRARPSIPRDIDRALLVDMSDALGVYDLDERIRYRLRERFWERCG